MSLSDLSSVNYSLHLVKYLINLSKSLLHFFSVTLFQYLFSVFFPLILTVSQQNL